MGYIDSGKKEGATVHYGGNRCGNEGYFINPTIFTDVKPEMKIVTEEIFGPVGVVIKFEDEEGMLFNSTSHVIHLSHSCSIHADVIRQANDTSASFFNLIPVVCSTDI